MDGTALARRLVSSGATHLQATPVTWRLLLESGWPGDFRLTAMCGGEALPSELASALLARTRAVWNFYGPTETTIYSAIKRVTGLPVTVGTPIANTSILILDDRQHPVPIGVTGELYIGGAGLARCYHRRPELTAERFVRHASGERLYRTGDLARWRADGEIDVLGRNDGQIKLRGYRIELREIEATLAAHPDLARAVVDVRPDAGGEPQLVAYVVGAADNLRAWLAERLPAYMVPSAFVSLDRLPTTPNGKVDRNALPAPVAAAPPSHVDFASPAERRVADAFANVLGHDEFGPDDDFFAVGGESMRAVRVVRQIDPDLSVLDLFTYPTVRALAAFLDRGVRSESRLLHRLSPTRTDAPALTVLCVPFGGGNAIAYQELAAHAPADWDVYAIQPPGHDPARPDEPLMAMGPLADACAADVLATICEQAGSLDASRPRPAPSGGPVLVYGHCVGAALAIQLARRLENAGVEVIGVSVGAAFPTSRLPGPLDLLARLSPGRRVSDRAVAETLRTMGGLGEELPAAHRRQLARAVRHDAREGELSYTEELRGTGPVPLRAPIQVIVGEKDPITEFYPERAHEWGAFGSTVDLAVVPGAGHFFQRTASAATLTDLLRAQVRRWRAGEPPTNPPAVPPHARLGAFAIVTLGQLVSLVGTGLTTFGLGVWTYQMVGTVTAFAAIAAFGIIPAVVLAPLAGAVADRYNRRLVMVGADAAGLASAGALGALLWSGQLALWHLYLMVVLSSAAATFRQPAYLAAVAQLTPKRYLGQANGIVVLGTATGTIVAQLAGGILVVAVGISGVVAIDIASYALALLSLFLVRFPDLAFVKRDGPLVREVVAGWRFIAQRRPLIALTVFFAVANALGSVVLVLVTPMVLAFGTPRLLGTVLAAQGAGLLAGGALMAVWGGAQRRSAGMIASVGLFAVSAMLIGVRPPGFLPVAFLPIAGMFGVGVCAALINAHWLSLVQVKVGHELMGRILATCLMLARTIMPIGYLVTGPLVDRVLTPATQRPGATGDLLRFIVGEGPGRGLAATVLLTGLVTLAWTLAGYRYRALREADDALPDATPERIDSAHSSA
jgi:surfactin synthase thioesterase subunit/MFS family permease